MDSTFESYKPELQTRFRFRRQWVLRDASEQPQAGWHVFQLNTRLHLLVQRDAFIFSKKVADSSELFLIGLALVRDSELDALFASIDHEEICAALDSIAGQYVVITVRNGAVALYTDPAGMAPVFYQGGFAASSPMLLARTDRDKELDRIYPLSGTDDWYTGSLTPFAGTRYLLANHYLDLESGVAARFWPRCVPVPQSPDQALNQIAQDLRSSIDSLIGRGKVIFSLTGGKDSRVNLAAARQHLSSAEFFTLRSKKIKACDLEIPQLLSERFGLRHRFIDIPAAPEWLTAFYDEISGKMAMGARREVIGACLQLEARDAIHVNGNLGALTKAFFWPDANPKVVHTKALAKEFINKAKPIMMGLEEWRRSLPDFLPPSVVYNLMYLEQRGGRWMGPGENASALFYQSISPFASRRIFEAISSMPNEFLHRGTILVDLVERLWPELLEIPYCRNTRRLSWFLPRSTKQHLKRWLSRK